LVFKAFTLLLPKPIEERLGGDPQLLPLVGLAAFAAMLCGAATQFTVGRLIDRTTLRRVFLPISAMLVPGLLAVTWAQGWLVLPFAAIVAAAIFGQVTVNETTTARYISPAMRTRMYSVRFFVGFIGAAAAAPMVACLHERTGSLAPATLAMAALAIVTFLCALAFPDRREELRPDLWGLAAAAAE
jgi:MFS family permease